MENDRFAPMRRHAFRVGHRYFGDAGFHVLDQTMPHSETDPDFTITEVELPTWAADLGGGGPVLLVDPCCIVAGEGPAFARCDWLRAAHLHLSGWLERSVEETSGPIQSYAFRLPDRWSRAYDVAWVNRIFLFIRRSIARRDDLDETEIFGALPQARFVLSHDVDALTKTIQIRLKSSVMSSIAVARHLVAGRFRKAAVRARDAIAYAFTSSSYWLFEDVCAAEAKYGFRSIFMFADRTAGKGAVAWLMDPSYRATDTSVASLIRQLHEDGWQVGIHPGFNSWNNVGYLKQTSRQVGAALGQPIVFCRQHWLRFSWKDTWILQARAGVKVDFTLGFNDRPGFRNGAAIRHRPWHQAAGGPCEVESIPTIIMDSHFYDYAFPEDPAAAMKPWIDEVIAVGGEASLLWHIHTMHAEFGWGPGYLALLDMLGAQGATVEKVQAHD